LADIYLGIFLSNGVLGKLPFNWMIIFHLGTGAIGIGLLAYYVHLYNNKAVNGQSKMKWLIGFILTGSFAMAFYWKQYIW
jgi:hypothetical protein